jgi:hypothetical protein
VDFLFSFFFKKKVGGWIRSPTLRLSVPETVYGPLSSFADPFSVKISCSRYSISSGKESSSGIYSDIRHIRKTGQAHHAQRLRAHAGRHVAGPTCSVLKKIL